MNRLRQTYILPLFIRFHLSSGPLHPPDLVQIVSVPSHQRDPCDVCDVSSEEKTLSWKLDGGRENVLLFELLLLLLKLFGGQV